MPFSTPGFENAQGIMDPSLLEYVGVVEDLWENIITNKSSLRPHKLIKDLNIFITR